LVRELSQFRQDQAWLIMVLNIIDYRYKPVLDLDLLKFLFKYRLGIITWVYFYFLKKQDIYGFLVKNLDLDSNLYNLKKALKKLVKYYETYPNPKRPYSGILPTRLAHPGSVGPQFFGGIVFYEVDIARKRKKVKNSSLGFLVVPPLLAFLLTRGASDPNFFWRNRFLKDRFTQKANRPIDREYPDEEPVKFFSYSHSF
jgi:hypothetical protein